MAERYLASIEAAGHGIVLFHDRVGDVGSNYALEIAERVVPELSRRGFVFVAPVLGFVAAGPRMASVSDRPGALVPNAMTLQLGDVDGDGRADACVHAPGDRRCGLSVELVGTEEDERPHTVFVERDGASCSLSFESEAIRLADVDGDGRADACATLGFGVACALATGSGACAREQKWLLADRQPAEGVVRFADLDADGRADVCFTTDNGITCALSTGRAFGPQTRWVSRTDARGESRSRDASPDGFELADVDGDGRADACWANGAQALECALSSGRRFEAPKTWSTDPALVCAPLLFADLNGDGRADVCARRDTGVACALSTGHGFTPSSTWLHPETSPDSARIVRSASLALGDVNGDGRADLCGDDGAGVVCALAP